MGSSVTVDQETLDKAVQFYWRAVVHDNLAPSQDTFDLIVIAYRRLAEIKANAQTTPRAA